MKAENQLYEMTCDGDRSRLKTGLLFYYSLNGKTDEFWRSIISVGRKLWTGIQDLADRYGLSGIAEAFRTEIM